MKILRFPLIAVLALAAFASLGCAQTTPEKVVINAGGPSHPFPHFWEGTFGSGRAILALRESYRSDFREVKKVTEFRYVRTMAFSGQSRVRTELFELTVIPALTPYPVQTNCEFAAIATLAICRPRRIAMGKNLLRRCGWLRTVTCAASTSR
jgi:hypothetical protein